MMNYRNMPPYGVCATPFKTLKKIKIESLEDILNLKGYEDERVKIIDILGIEKKKKEVDEKNILGITKKIIKEVIAVERSIDIKLLIKPTGETCVYSFISIGALIHMMKGIFEKLYSNEVIGFTGRNVANFIRKNLDKKFIILTSLEKFTRIGGVFCGNSSKEIKTGIIIPKEHYEDAIAGFKEQEIYFTNIIGMEYSDGISDCPGGSFSDWE